MWGIGEIIPIAHTVPQPLKDATDDADGGSRVRQHFRNPYYDY
jgi:hypothetical protein